MTKLVLTAIAAALALTGRPVNAADDWNQWRGPHRDGVLPAPMPKAWPKQFKKLWSVDVGIGHASPLLVGKRAYVFSRQGEEEVLRCLDAESGTQIWKSSYPAPYEMNPAARGHGKGPKATPAFADGRIYTFGISGILRCTDASNGTPVWSHEYAKEFKASSPAFGVSVSPLVDGGMVVVHAGGAGEGAITAYDARTGSQRWQWRGDGPAYASPMIADIGGTRQVVTQTQKMIVSLDSTTGALLWSLPFTTPYEQNIITPIIWKDSIILAGLQQPMFAVRPKKMGTAWSAEKLWENRDVNLYMSTPVLSGGKLYGMSNKMRGQLFTVDAATGKTIWMDQQGRFGDNATLYAGASVILAQNTNGELHVFSIESDSLKPVQTYQDAESPTWASPAIQGRRILVKDLEKLTLWEIDA